MARIFDMDNKFHVIMGKVADLIILNIVFMITCIPIVTIGPALIGLYEVTLKMVKNQESYIVKSYMQAFKANMKRGISVGIVVEIVALILAVDLWLIMGNEGELWMVLKVVLLAISIAIAMMASYVFPVFAKFNDPMKSIIKSTVYMMIGFLPVSLGITIFNCLPVIIFFCIDSYQVIFYLVAVYMVIGCALTAFLNSIMLTSVFDKIVKN